MKEKFLLWNRFVAWVTCGVIMVLVCANGANALDTDIYKIDVRNNAYLLMDNSGSMSFGVYEHTIDYGEMFDYFFTLHDSPAGDYYDYIYDTVNNNSYFYQNHKERRKIFLWKGQIGLTIASVDGEDVAFTGDAANPNYIWYSSDLIDTHTMIDEDGNLVGDGSGNAQRLTVDDEGFVLLDGERLPLGQDIKLHKMQTLYDGSQVDSGFGGLLNAPGYYFSGYEGVTENSLDVAEDGDNDIFFFVTGNWANMQAMYNLHYTTNTGLPDTDARYDDMAWKYEPFPVSSESWSLLAYDVKYPEGADDVLYDNNLTEENTIRTIVHSGTTKIQLHFASFDVEGDGESSTFAYDFVALYDASGNRIVRYDNDNIPADGWSATIPGDTASIKLSTDGSVQGTGYTIDKIRVVYISDGDEDYYLMQSRLDVAKDAMSYVVEQFLGKINWGFSTFNYNGTTADGADIKSVVNPNLQDDANGNELLNHISQVEPKYGTPLGEALQDVFEVGYYRHRNALQHYECAKSYLIVMSDGFPSGDNDWSRINNVGTFSDFDGDGWTQDPYQYSNPPDDYYDDVAHWMYTHSWIDKSEVEDPANSYENVITHHISFGAYHPLLEDAAGESGGIYVATYNKAQVVSAFYSLGLMISEAVSFTAPVVSVDATNKIQSGDDLYMGLFLPQYGRSWVGNLKKFKLGDGSADRPKFWMIYDANNQEAINDEGAFRDNTAGFWGDDNDANDSDNNGAADVTEDGVGEVLAERVMEAFSSGDYWERDIYTYLNGAIKKFNRDNITAADLDVEDNATRDKLVNYVYGYSYDADATTGAPLAVRNWVLGAIVHSRPVILDYYNADENLSLSKRYIAIGANDGMLHIFDDETGKEVFAFIPPDILPSLKLVQSNDFYDTVDGEITLYRKDVNPKYLIFGERRGGKTYWCLDVSEEDPLLWEVEWQYTHDEIKQSWSRVELARIPIAVDPATGERTYRDVAIFTGGYDPEEDHFPEPFFDADNNGSPYDENGNLQISGTSKEWDTGAAYDIYDNDSYDIYNPEKNEFGRGIFIVDIDTPENVVVNPVRTGENLLPFSVIYGENNETTGASQTLSSMKFCLPGTPSVVRAGESYVYGEGGGGSVGVAFNVLRQLYATDIYTNIFKVVLDYEIYFDEGDGKHKFKDIGWSVQEIFSGNPGSLSTSGTFGAGEDAGDTGRKSFHSPAVSWGGSGDYFDQRNYFFYNSEGIEVKFFGTDRIATLFFGTGDREHPRYKMVRNRMYALYDDSAVSAKKYDGGVLQGDIIVSTAPYTEDDLLNLSADELGRDTTIVSCYLGSLDGRCDGGTDTETISRAMKGYLRDLLTDDAISTDTSGEMVLENGTFEDDVKGWYIVLEDQALDPIHVEYAASLVTDSDDDRDNHVGEKILAKPALFYDRVYFTSYQPSYDNPCNPQGNGFTYALNYLDGSAAFNLNAGNDGNEEEKLDVSDRYQKYTGIFGIPSGFTVIMRDGRAAAMASMGGAIVGPGVDGDPEIPSPGLGLELYYWREGTPDN